MPTRESKPEGCHMDRMGSESTTKGHLLQLPDGRREILSTSPTADALTPQSIVGIALASLPEHTCLQRAPWNK